MSTKKKNNTKTKDEATKFSYEFLDMLSDTAFITLNEHLKKTKAPREVIHLIDIAYCLVLEQINLLQGGKQNNDSLPNYVADAIQCISALGGQWYSPTGSVTPLKKMLAMKAKGK